MLPARTNGYPQVPTLQLSHDVPACSAAYNLLSNSHLWAECRLPVQDEEYAFQNEAADRADPCRGHGHDVLVGSIQFAKLAAVLPLPRRDPGELRV